MRPTPTVGRNHGKTTASRYASSWRPALGADLGGAVQRPARVGELLADPLGLGCAGQLLDQPQGAEDPRGHPGGGGEGAVLDIALAADPAHLGAAALQATNARPVRGGPATIKQAAGGEQPGAVAHAQQVGSPVDPAADPLAQRYFLLAVWGSHGRDHEHVRFGRHARVDVVQRVVGRHGQPT